MGTWGKALLLGEGSSYWHLGWCFSLDQLKGWSDDKRRSHLHLEGKKLEGNRVCGHGRDSSKISDMLFRIEVSKHKVFQYDRGRRM